MFCFWGLSFFIDNRHNVSVLYFVQKTKKTKHQKKTRTEKHIQHMQKKKCDSGYSGVATLCYEDCPSSFTDTGLYCEKPAEYGRGPFFECVCLYLCLFFLLAQIRIYFCFLCLYCVVFLIDGNT